MIRSAVVLGFLALNFWAYHYLATRPVIPPRETFASFPLELGQWTCKQRQKMKPEVESNLGVTDYLICDFISSDETQLVNVYLGYHASQVREEGGGARENSIHPPAHCLPGSGWDIVDSHDVTVDFEGMPERPAKVKRLIIARGNARQLTYYWYQSRGRVIADDWRKILFVGWDRALRGRTDGSLVRFSIPVFRNDIESADRDFRDLAPRILKRLPAYVPG